MDESVLMNAFVQVKRMNNLLNEISDETRELAAEVDRDDQVTISMVLSMRGESIEKLKAADAALRDQIQHASETDAAQLRALLKREGASGAQEIAFVQTVEANQRILKSVVELDRIINQKLTRGRSVYQKN